MKATLIFILVLCLETGISLGQDFSLYSNEKLAIHSVYLQETVDLNLHVPETQPFAAKDTKYPITILFDSQHESTYPLIINAIDLLTSESQMPESILIGVPFNIQNRLYLTSTQKQKNDSLSGIERMELFLFNELIPELQRKYHANSYLTLIGHSRTAFLVNYLTFKRPSEINLAVALSGFFNDEPLSLQTFYNFLSDSTQFPHQFNYYFTAGTSLEEANYWVQLKQLDSLMSKQSLAQNVNIKLYETPHANHITNYWISTPKILMEVFSPYNDILNSWFHDTQKALLGDKPIQQFKADLENVSASIGVQLNPNITQIYSLASHYMNMLQDYKTAIQFFELGLEYYPDYLDFYIEIIEICNITKDTKAIRHYKAILSEKTKNSNHLSDSEKDELFNYLNEQ